MGTMKISQIANLTGIITAKASDEGYVGVFGDRLEVSEIRKKSSIFDDLKMMETQSRSIGQSTEAGIWLFWDKAIREKQHWDTVFTYSDMQAGHGGLYTQYAIGEYSLDSHYHHINIPKLIQKYRQEVNPHVNVFLVQVAGYTDTIMPEFYNRTYILGGWGDGILKFADTMIKSQNQ